jgi:hypothetical protein
VLPAEWQVIAFLSSVCNLVFLLFGRGARALLLSGTVWSAEPHALQILEAKVHLSV